MRFLDAAPQVHSLEGPANGEYMWWVVDILDSRPTLLQAAATTCAHYKEKFQAKLEETRCIIQCAAMYIDTDGGIIVFKTHSNVQTSNAKSGGKSIAKLMCAEQSKRFLSTLHHMDEYDKFRISRFKTLNNYLEQLEHVNTECEQQLAVRAPVGTEVVAWGSGVEEVTEERLLFVDDVLQTKWHIMRGCTIEAISVGIWPPGAWCAVSARTRSAGLRGCLSY